MPRAESARPGPRRPRRRRGSKRGYLDGQMLIACRRWATIACAQRDLHVRHSTEGAMGIVVNQPAAHISFTDLLVQLEVVPAAE